VKVGEQVLESIVLAGRNASLHEVVPPHVVDHVVSEFPAESPDVAQERRTEQAVAEKSRPLALQLVQFLSPPAADHTHIG